MLKLTAFHTMISNAVVVLPGRLNSEICRPAGLYRTWRRQFAWKQNKRTKVEKVVLDPLGKSISTVTDMCATVSLRMWKYGYSCITIDHQQEVQQRFCWYSLFIFAGNPPCLRLHIFTLAFNGFSHQCVTYRFLRRFLI